MPPKATVDKDGKPSITSGALNRDEKGRKETMKEILGDPFEMEVRALVAALELGHVNVSRTRAGALLDRQGDLNE